MLCDGDEHRLVVGGRVDRGHLVSTRGQTTGYFSSKDAVHRLRVETLEEVELRRIRGRRARDRVNRLNDDVRVSVDHAVGSEVLRGSEVVQVRVHEEACVQVVDRHLHGEVRVCLDRVEVLREDELRGRHRSRSSNQAHRGAVTRAGLDLRAIREGEVRRRAEVDEVVLGGG